MDSSVSDLRGISQRSHTLVFTGSLFGFVLAWCSLTPIFICISFATLILFRRDLHTISYFLGLLFSEAFNYVMKHLIKEPRPLMDGHDSLFTEYGMPSSHAQFMSFFSIYLLLFLFIRVQSSLSVFDNLWKYIAVFISFTISVIVFYGRVYLLYHTTNQVLWGAVCGFVLAILWFIIVQFTLTPLFPIIAAWPVSEYLMVRDSTLIPNVLWFEYCSHRSEARSRHRKQSIRKLT